MVGILESNYTLLFLHKIEKTDLETNHAFTNGSVIDLNAKLRLGVLILKLLCVRQKSKIYLKTESKMTQSIEEKEMKLWSTNDEYEYHSDFTYQLLNNKNTNRTCHHTNDRVNI